MSSATLTDRHRQGHEAFAKGDMETLGTLIAEDTVWHWPGDNPFSGDHEGRASVFAAFEQMAELTGGNMEVEGLAYMENESYTAALTKLTATRGEKTLTTLGCEVCRWENGQVVEEWNFVADRRAHDEFWSE